MWSVAIACPTAASLPLSPGPGVRRSVVVVGAIAAVRGQMCYTYEYVVKWMRWRGGRGDGWSAPQKVMLLLKGRASRRGMDSVITRELESLWRMILIKSHDLLATNRLISLAIWYDPNPWDKSQATPKRESGQ